MNGKDRWRSHPVLGATMSGAAMMAPFVVSVVTAGVVGRVLPEVTAGQSTSFGGPQCRSLRRWPSWCQGALSPVAARQELTRGAGSQFDPAIVRALLNMSIGRVRWVIGPVSWVADVPLLAGLSVAGHALVTTTQVVVGAAASTAAGALAAHAAAPTVHTHVPTSGLVLAAPTIRCKRVLGCDRGP